MGKMNDGPMNVAAPGMETKPVADAAAAAAADLLHGAILYLDGITVSFDGFHALDDLSLDIERGELRCIIGPNGAGKSTMMDVVTGKTRPDVGEAYFDRQFDLLKMSETDIVKAGIGRKFQKPTVFEQLPVVVNLELAMRAKKGVWATLMVRLNGEQRDRIDAVLATIGLIDCRHQHAGALSHGQKQWLEIGMLLMQEPQLMLIDEPAAGMTHQEVERTAELLVSLAGERSVVVVEHDMDFVRSIARRVTVLHEGRVLADGSMDTVQNDPKVLEVYLGS